MAPGSLGWCPNAVVHDFSKHDCELPPELTVEAAVSSAGYGPCGLREVQSL